MPPWVDLAVSKYLSQLKEYCNFKLIEFSLEKRVKSQNKSLAIKQEASKINQLLPKHSFIIALDSQGELLSSLKLANKLEQIQLNNSQICFIIGGPDGLDQDILTCVNETWSLSKLTFSHPLVRVVILEALYRGFAIINNHPYHR